MLTSPPLIVLKQCFRAYRGNRCGATAWLYMGSKLLTVQSTKGTSILIVAQGDSYGSNRRPRLIYHLRPLKSNSPDGSNRNSSLFRLGESNFGEGPVLPSMEEGPHVGTVTRSQCINSHVGMSKNQGPQYKPQHTGILIIRTPKRSRLFWEIPM